jgi:hypothetical protein
VNGVEGKKRRGAEGNPSAGRQTANKDKHHAGGSDVAQNRRQVPSYGVKPKHCVIQAKPQQKQGAVIISIYMRIQFRPGMGSKVMRQVSPGVDARVLDDLWFVVVNELKPESGDKNEKSEGTNKRLSDAPPFNPGQQASVFGSGLNLHYLPDSPIDQIFGSVMTISPDETSVSKCHSAVTVSHQSPAMLLPS